MAQCPYVWRQLSFLAAGLFYGYSIEAIQTFIDRFAHITGRTKLDVVPDSEGTPYYGHGYIPASSERERDPNEVVAEINARRIATIPFSLDMKHPEPGSDELVKFIDSPRCLELIKEHAPKLRFYSN